MVAVALLVVWTMLVFAKTFVLICVFTFVIGSASAYTSVVLPIYIAEISSAHIRGYLGVLHTVTGNTGLLIMYAVGPFLSVQMAPWVFIVPVGLFIAIYWWLPESPYHLLGTSKYAEAEISLQRLRCNLEVKEELAQMEASVKESQENRGTFRELFFHPRNRQSIIVVLGLSALLELCGSQIVLQYAQTIFATLDTNLDPKNASIMFGVAQLSGPIVACFLTDSMGRRPLLLISIVLSGLCTMVIGVYYILERHIDVTGLGWLPISAILAFMVTYTVGILVLMHVITAELFPKHLRGVAAATKAINIPWIGLVLVYLYQYVVDVLGMDYVFIGFSLMTFAFVPFVLFLVPETTRKTLEGILNETYTGKKIEAR